MGYRRWIAVSFALSSLIIGSTAYYMWAVAPRWLHVRRLRIGLAGLPTEWRGLRIAHLSDFHLGQRRAPKELLWAAREQALEFSPDLTVLTGDFYDDGRAVEHDGLFGDWPAGVTLAVLGNHDHRGGREHVAHLASELRDGGVRLLGNEATSVEIRGRTAWIAAVDDPYSGRDDINAALAGLPSGETALLLLAHAPTVADTMPNGAARLMLCGHTHGGQIRLLPSGRTPFLRLIHWAIREPRRNEPSIHHGLHWVRGAVVCISNGLGMSQLPLRFRTRPQVVLIELGEVANSQTPCDDVRRYVEDQTHESRLARWLA